MLFCKVGCVLPNTAKLARVLGRTLLLPPVPCRVSLHIHGQHFHTTTGYFTNDVFAQNALITVKGAEAWFAMRSVSVQYSSFVQVQHW